MLAKLDFFVADCLLVLPGSAPEDLRRRNTAFLELCGYSN
jgi:hypothetical protein